MTDAPRGKTPRGFLRAGKKGFGYAEKLELFARK